MKRPYLFIFLCLFLLASDKAPKDAGLFTMRLPLVSTPPSKAGIAWASWGRMQTDVETLNAGWFYTWGLSADIDTSAEFVPMFWSYQWPPMLWPPTTDFFQQMDDIYGAGCPSRLLFLNEPDLHGTDTGGQAELTPRQGAYLYKALRERCPGTHIIGPCISHGDYLAGWPWLKHFNRLLVKLDLPSPDEACLHTYVESEPAQLITESLLKETGMASLWVAEFGSCDPVWTREAILYFQNEERVTRYAWFTVRRWDDGPCLTLFDNKWDNELSKVGEVWMELHPD